MIRFWFDINERNGRVLIQRLIALRVLVPLVFPLRVVVERQDYRRVVVAAAFLPAPNLYAIDDIDLADFHGVHSTRKEPS